MVDTNMAMVADGAHSDASAACVAASARALQGLMTAGHLFVDDGGLIVREYRATLGYAGPPSPGRAFLRWVLTHEWAGARVTGVVITSKDEDPEDFHEVPPAPPGVQYDRSDRKFLAVAAGHTTRPAILDLAVVPRVAVGRFDLNALIRLLGESKLGPGPSEGLYVRRDEGDWLAARAKLVRAEFVQNIGIHWSRRPLRTNKLASDGDDRKRARDVVGGH